MSAMVYSPLMRTRRSSGDASEKGQGEEPSLQGEDVSMIMSDTSNRSVSTTASPLLKQSILRDIGDFVARNEDEYSVSAPSTSRGGASDRELLHNYSEQTRRQRRALSKTDARAVEDVSIRYESSIFELLEADRAHDALQLVEEVHRLLDKGKHFCPCLP